MHPANRPRIAFIGDISRYSLIGLLVINILSPFVILFINPEAFFLGQKIAGTPAKVYALGLFLATALVMCCLYKKSKGYAFVALVYAMIFFINGYLIVLDNNGRFPPAIYWLVLLLSAIVCGTTLSVSPKKPAGPCEKSIWTVFADKPSAGLVLSAGVLVCFLLYSSIAVMTYEKEYNSYVYQIEIYPAAPLHNVTLLVPLPSGISQNITEGDLPGSSLPYFTNYSQSVVETGDGKMIKIMANSIEKKDIGLPEDDSIRLYQSILVTGPVHSVSPLDREPVLLPKYSHRPSSCRDKTSQGIVFDKRALNCSVYESRIFASFETIPSSQTVITVSVEGERTISSSQSPRREGYKDSITTTVSGHADGWYNASGSLLAG